MLNHDGTVRSNPNRPEWFDKWKCLQNFLTVFSQHDITLVADKIDDATFDRLTKDYKDINIVRTDYGSNAETFLYCLDQSLLLNDHKDVYFVEDDYLHHEGADIILEQGLQRSPYVSLYDHPDKYWNENANQPSIILMTEDCHWRTTSSTTMTFASRVSTLKQDLEVFKKWCGGADKWTHDFQLFTELSTKRKLITPIPGYATHLDSWVIAKMVDWKSCLDRTCHDI